LGRTCTYLFFLVCAADFDAISAFAPDAIDGVLACIEAARSGAPAMDGLEDVLRELAERGFAAVDDDKDPRAELVSVYNVGGVVLKSTFAPGVPRAAWGENRKVVLARGPRAKAPSLWRRLWPF
jgi:hypothetical protein